MFIEDINELKTGLVNFQQVLDTGIKSDPETPAEAKELLTSLIKVNETLKGVESHDQFKELLGDFGANLLHILSAAQAFSEIDEDEMYDDEMDEELLSAALGCDEK